MDIITLVITLLVILGVFAVVWWAVERMGVPEPIKTIVLAILALIGLVVIYNSFVGGTGVHLPRLH